MNIVKTTSAAKQGMTWREVGVGTWNKLGGYFCGPIQR